MTRSLADWLSYLEQLHPVSIDMGLERARQVLQRLNLGRLAPRVITVTGTNGKGSTCAFLASLLRSAGLRVGVYSSPHMLRYNERVLLADGEASDEQLCEAFAAVEAARGDISLTYFEMGTLAAFWLFERAALDAVVLEVGLGGRLDAVNLVDADLAVVTSIGIDHVEWLGDSRDSVAVEKAGIFRAGRPALCGDPQPPASLLARAAQIGCTLYLRGTDFDLDEQAQAWSWRGRDADGRPLALHDLALLDLPQDNAALALQAYALLGLPWRAAALAQALQDTRIAGRLERRSIDWQGRRLSLLLDVGHNPHAAVYLAGRLARRAPRGRRLAVFGLLADKDLHGVLAPLHGLIADWAVAPLPTPRSRTADELQTALAALGARVTAWPSLAQALETQCAQAGEDDEILVFGSFYSVAEALAWLQSRS
ncbi:bifunctional tetrahydrofolate synthase/dihydrofolate synthase [Geopseudomonas guangdongensis]|uniref:Dihydrofolate synthase/folylpolyglutamate synthase n=1 Tax=Geopseudomonas guangdongensis TaxID=1245526 RepID=A0A1H2E057_9GAMM|nr:bifunctional tetrahydrofolate synthase/dihydrofolate synthase [Pseudomonas guangdongensis]SDT88369.1 dihydrofolate synthase / folylpolyglutamate synthase [Pseudomonas guangdongensis]